MDYLNYIRANQLLAADSVDYLQLERFLQRFRDDRYGEGHGLLVAYASFPVFLTPDLLYKLWLNFQRYTDEAGRSRQIARVAVNDLLLSGMVREAASEVFEMAAPLRNAMLVCLEERFRGEKDILRELAQFMLYYVRSFQLEGESITNVIREAQEWNALAYVDPAAAAREIRQALAGAVHARNASRQLRIGLMLERLDEQYAKLGSSARQADAFRTLVSYSRGMRDFIQGNHRDAFDIFQELQQQAGGKPGAGGTTARRVQMPIPRAVSEGLRERAQRHEPPRGKVYALLAGIDEYPNLPKLRGAARDASDMSQWLKQAAGEERLEQHLMLNESASLKAFGDQVLQVLARAKEEDVVFLFFAGHGLNRLQGSERNALLFHGYDQRIPSAEVLYDEDMRKFVEAYATRDPHILMIIDTHSGGNRWLDPDNEKHVVLAACSEEENAYESNNRGAFTEALIRLLQQSQGQVTYRRLVRNIRRELRERFEQTPQLHAATAGKDMLFLSGRKDTVPSLLELLQDSGYYEGPVRSDVEAFSAAMARFREDWNVGQDEDILELLMQKALVHQAKQLRVFIGGFVDDKLFNEFSVRLKRLPYPVRVSRLDDPAELASQKMQKQSQTTRKAVMPSTLDDAHLVVLMIDESFLKAPEGAAMVGRIRQRRQTDYLPVVALLAQPCPWASHPVAELPEMAMYRAKGRFGEQGWLLQEGWKMTERALNRLARFLVPRDTEQYLSLCDGFRDDMPFAEMEALGSRLRSAAAGLKDTGLLLEQLNLSAPQGRVFGAAMAIQARPDRDQLSPLVSYLREVAGHGQLNNLRHNVLYQLITGLQKIIQLADAPSEYAAVIDPLLKIAGHARTKEDNRKAGPGGIGNLIYRTVENLAVLMQTDLLPFLFREPVISEALALGNISVADLHVSLGSPEQIIAFFERCEAFKGYMSVSAMDGLGRQLKDRIKSLNETEWLAEWLKPGIFQGYLFGIAMAAHERPGLPFLVPAVQFLEATARESDLGGIRLRVLYRLLMALESILGSEAVTLLSGDSLSDISIRAKSALERIGSSERVVQDNVNNGDKGIGARINLVSSKLRPFIKQPAGQTDELAEALFDLDFSEQLEQVTKREAGGRLHFYLLNGPPQSSPALLCAVLCRRLNLPLERLLLVKRSDIAPYGWEERRFIDTLMNMLGMIQTVEADIPTFASLLSSQSVYQEIILYIDCQSGHPLPAYLADDFFSHLMDFLDRLETTLAEGNTGYIQFRVFAGADRIPTEFSRSTALRRLQPVICRPVTPVSPQDIESWLLSDAPEAVQMIIREKVLARYEPAYPLELIARICDELGLRDQVYLPHFSRYEIREASGGEPNAPVQA